ncbi:hypothetical protein Rwratislav_33722 [Rhodococcus wratislaviensis IFP 2016]|nr:hypothetical protein Rwratislav_33722 [Rhodococcus wratislaviensis IFP 2016]
MSDGAPTAAAQAAAQDGRENVDRLRGELADLRTEVRTDLDQVRADHVAQLAEVRQSASERVDALTTALRVAERTIEELSGGPADAAPTPDPGNAPTPPHRRTTQMQVSGMMTRCPLSQPPSERHTR